MYISINPELQDQASGSWFRTFGSLVNSSAEVGPVPAVAPAALTDQPSGTAQNQVASVCDKEAAKVSSSWKGGAINKPYMSQSQALVVRWTAWLLQVDFDTLKSPSFPLRSRRRRSDSLSRCPQQSEPWLRYCFHSVASKVETEPVLNGT